MTHTPPPPPQDPHLEHWEPAPSKRRWPHAVAYVILIATVIILMAAVLADEEPTVLPKSSGSLPTESADDLVDPADVPTDVAPVPEPTPEPTPTSVRGNIFKEIGDTVTVIDTWDEDRPLAEFIVTDIEVTTEGQWDNEFANDPPENGHFLILSVEGSTFPDLAEGDRWSISDWDFDLFTPDGTRVNEPSTSAAWSALDPADRVPSDFGPGESFSGKIALDSPTEHGVIVYGGGVEWEF